MEKGQVFPAEVEKVVFGGDGMVKAPDGMVVFIPGVLPGERLQVELTEVRKNFGRGAALKRMESSPDRVEPVCPYAHLCCNCKYLCTSLENENRLKKRQLVDMAMQHFPEAAELIGDTVSCGDGFYYRNKAGFHAHRVGNLLDLGYVKSDNVSVTDIEACMLLHPALNEELSRIRANESFMHSLRDGMELTLRYSSLDEKVTVWRNSPDERASWLKEKLSFGNFSVPVGSFFQVNLPVADLLAQQVAKLVREVNPEMVLDLYCGAGFFALAVAAMTNVKRIRGLEIDSAAVKCAEYNLRQSGFGGDAGFVAGDAAKTLQPLLQKVSGKEALAIIDPPRTGLDGKSANLLAQAEKIRHLIYISCNPATYARDVFRLSKSGFVIRQLTPYNMFPRTGHFELFSYLERV